VADFETIDVTNLDVMSVPFDLRRDMHTFVQYVRENEVKRLVRDNRLSVVDYRRLATLLSDPDAKEQIAADNISLWVDYVDGRALRLGLVDYDTEGVYRSYNSRSPSFPDNYVICDERAYRAFLDLPLGEQERRLRELYVNKTEGCASEFYHRDYFGRLSMFNSRGCATGVVDRLDFPKARRFLLKTLSQLEVGRWFSVASLVHYLKQEYPYFLIPKEPPEYRLGYKETKRTRYVNFRESRDYWGRDAERIPDDAPDGFERVEGRYVARFLENWPLTLGYVEVAYGEEPKEELYPSLGHLKAFRVTQRLAQVQQDAVPEPRVTVQPNFEVYVESTIYPASTIYHLQPLTEIRSEDVLTVLKLDKDQVMATLVEDENLDVVALLKDLSDRPLPNNVVRELHEWSSRTDAFTLYRGFTLLEGDEEVLVAHDLIERQTVQRITEGVRLVRDADAVFEHLEAAEQVPIRVKHRTAKLVRLPRGSQTRFPVRYAAAKRKPKPKPAVSLTRSTHIMLHTPDQSFLEALRQALLDAKCPVRLDDGGEMLIVPGVYREQLDEALDALGKRYTISVKDAKGNAYDRG
jgi:hypothetical protein